MDVNWKWQVSFWEGEGGEGKGLCVFVFSLQELGFRDCSMELRKVCSRQPFLLALLTSSKPSGFRGLGLRVEAQQVDPTLDPQAQP